MTDELLEREDRLLVRKFDATIHEDGDGRTLEGMVIPYGIVSEVTDPPDFTPYNEMIMPGAFRNSTKAPNRVLLDFEHYGAANDLMMSGRSMAGTLGWATELEDREDGLYGKFRVANHPDGDKALELVRAGVLGAFSAAYKPLRSLRNSAGVVHRAKAHLDGVSLCRVGAFEQAKVLAVRNDPFTEEKLRPFDTILTEKLEQLGIPVPSRLKAESL